VIEANAGEVDIVLTPYGAFSNYGPAYDDFIKKNLLKTATEYCLNK
jgi:hypothetical protein